MNKKNELLLLTYINIGGSGASFSFLFFLLSSFVFFFFFIRVRVARLCADRRRDKAVTRGR